MIVLDTSVLVSSFTGARASGPAMRRALEDGEWLVAPALVHFEWLRGPREETELARQEALLPLRSAPPFGLAEASVAATIYGSLDRTRGREVDLAIAAHALVEGAKLWTLNVRDFVDVPGLELYEPPS